MMKKTLSGLQVAVQAIVLTIVFSAMAAASAGLLALQVIREF
jgi:hypothetical protein